MKKKFLSVICSLAMAVTLMPQMQVVQSNVMADTTTMVTPEYKIQDGNDAISWQSITGAQSYNVYEAASRFGTYTKIDSVSGSSYEVSSENKYYKIAAVIDGVEKEQSKPVSEELQMFGDNVIFYAPSDDSSKIQKEVDDIFTAQETAQFDENRYALMFKKGTYSDNLKVNVGFYTQVAGISALPTDTQIGGLEVSANWLFANNGETKNATQNFWRSTENLTVNSNVMWAVSQATSFRRMNVKGNLTLVDNGSWASGGYTSDSVISGTLEHGGQQQWFNRNTKAASFNGTSWNMVNVGCSGARGGNDTIQDTIVAQTPESAERPYLICDDNNDFSVIVPAYKENTSGISWQNADDGSKKLSIDNFYIAKPGVDTADTINAALKSGKNLIFTPGVYRIDKAIEVTNANTVVLGLGYATLEPTNGTEAMKIADVSGVRVAGLLFEAGTKNSETLLRVGESDASAEHADNPVVLSDLFFRVGGANHTEKVSCDTCVIINSDDVIGDNFWVWRADHGWDASVGWDDNICYNGLIVNGDDVTIYALMVEHFEEYQTIWNGNGGKTYFYQSEMPYDVPSAEEYMSHNGTVEGWASYKVADNVTTHEASGLGMYSFYTGAAINQESAMEVPLADGVKITNALTHNLANSGEVKHVINNIGSSTRESYCPTVKNFNNNYLKKVSISPKSGTYFNKQKVSISCESENAEIYYTTNGSEPSKTNGTLYTAPFEVTSTTTVRAKAVADDVLPAQDEVNINVINEDNNNILLGKKMSASTEKGGTENVAQNVTDGSNSTRWESEWEDKQWIKADLGGIYDVTGFKIKWDWAAAKAYTVQVSQDGANWVNVYKKTDGSNNGQVSYTFKNAKTAAYIRVYCTERVSEYGNSMINFEVYGSEKENISYTDAPHSLKISAVNKNNVTLTWDETANAVSYNIYRMTGTVSKKYLKLNEEPVMANTYTDNINILNADKYAYKVTAVSETGFESVMSDFAVVSTRDNYGSEAFDYSDGANTSKDPEEPTTAEEKVTDDEEELDNSGTILPDTDNPAEGRHEAEAADSFEQGSASGTYTIQSDANYSGGQAIGGMDSWPADGRAYCTTFVNADKAGTYEMTIGYAGGEANHPCNIDVRLNDGEWVSTEASPTAAWNTVGTVKLNIKLKKGTNSIDVTGASNIWYEGMGWEWINLDYFDLKLVSADSEETTSAQETTTPSETTAEDVTTKPEVTTKAPQTTKAPEKVTVKKPGRTKVLKVKRQGKKAKISLKKIKGAAKYQIKYAANKKFKKSKTVTVKGTKATIKKMSKKKTYYFKARAVKVVSGKRYYGKWSKVKRVK